MNEMIVRDERERPALFIITLDRLGLYGPIGTPMRLFSFIAEEKLGLSGISSEW